MNNRVEGGRFSGGTTEDSPDWRKCMYGASESSPGCTVHTGSLKEVAKVEEGVKVRFGLRSDDRHKPHSHIVAVREGKCHQRAGVP